MIPVTSVGFGVMDPLAQQTQQAGMTSPAANPNGPSFASSLANAVQQVNTLQLQSADQTRSFVLGQSNDIHTVMIASQKASVALELTTQVRNKVLDAYNTVMQMTM
jgi:flagellar hook-basal body complex protein FliE